MMTAPYPISTMQELEPRSIPGLVATWGLMIPLYCLACDGLLWFRPGAGNDELSARFGSLGTGASDTAGNTFVALLLIALLFPLVHARLPRIWLAFKTDKLFLLLGTWVCASCIWSQMPGVSLKWAPIALLNLLTAFYMVERFSVEEQIRVFLLLGALCLVSSVFLALLVPRLGIDHTDGSGAWRGMYAQKNMCSMVTEFLLLPALYVRPTHRLTSVLLIAYVAVSVLLVLETQSTSGRIILAVLAVYFTFTRLTSRLVWRQRLGLSIGVALLAVAMAAFCISYSGEIARALGKDPSLTGRTEIWQSVIASIAKRPLTGYGYRAFWRGYDGESANIALATHWAVPSAHNGILEIWLNLGGIGVLLVTLTAMRAARDALTCLRTRVRGLEWYVSILFMTFVINVDEAELVNPYGLLWLLYVVACVGLLLNAAGIRRGAVRA